MNQIESYKKDLLSKFKKLQTDYYHLILIVSTSFIARIAYVFYFNNYKHYVVSDMKGYWKSALNLYNGDLFSMFNWAAWPVFFKIYLSFLFKIFAFWGLSKYLLESVLFFHIILSSISVIFFYLICKELLGNKKKSLFAAFIYAFTYPLVYLNIFILTENVSTPLLVISTYFLFKSSNKKFSLLINGVIFGFATAVRPSLLPLFLSFFLYILFSKRFTVHSLIRGVFFSVGFFFIIFLASVQIFHISKGAVHGLHNSTGANFFLAQCKYRAVSSTYKGRNFFLGPPLNWKHKEWTVFKTNHAINEQKYFYNLGSECMKKNPHWLKERLSNLGELFIGDFFPGFSSIKYFHPLIDLSKWATLCMLYLSLFLYSPFKNGLVDRAKSLFLISIPLSVICPSFFFQPESRYLCQALFAIELLCFLAWSGYKADKTKSL